MTPEIATKTWVEYRNKKNQTGLGTRARAPHTRAGRYQAHTQMRNVQAGDHIIHLIQRDDGPNWFIGKSVARTNVRRDDSNYVVPLDEYTEFPEPLGYDLFTRRHRKKIRAVIEGKPHYQPFQENRDPGTFKIPEGFYFGVAMPELTNELTGLEEGILTNDKNKDNKGDAGPARGGERVSVIWNAKHSPLVKELVSFVDDHGFRTLSGYVWKPDILMRNSDAIVLIEVKPEASLHNIITAIGQIICYRSPFKEEIVSVIAAKGSLGESQLTKVLKDNRVDYLDIGGNWKRTLLKLVQQ